MSEIMLTVRDAGRSLQGTVHGATADRVVAALAAEPETIEELDEALRRWERREAGRSAFGHFRPGDDETSWDAGVVIIDLAARFIAYESTWSELMNEGSEQYHDGNCATDKWFNFRLPSDWRIENSLNGWRSIVDSRRGERAKVSPLEWRVVAYDLICDEIAAECRRMWREGVRVDGAAADEYAAFAPFRSAIRESHAKWLLTARDELRGRSPRELFFEHRSRINLDLQWRGSQWSMLGSCPSGLSREAHAFRYGGAGTHEWVLHCEMVRHLYWECWERFSSFGAVGERVDASAEAARLRKVRDEWLDTPQFADLSGRAPRAVIERERMRMPEGVSGSEAHVDCDCPICRMMMESNDVYFWNLDGCNMDDEFAFTYHATREEYNKQQQEYEKWSAEFDRKQAERKTLGLNDENQPWSRSYVNWDYLDDQQAGRLSAFTLLFGVGCQLAELNCDLKQADPDTNAPSLLNRDFGNLRAVLNDRDEALIEPVLNKFRETLADVAVSHANAAAKCEALSTTLARLTRRLNDEDAFDDKPFSENDVEWNGNPFGDDDSDEFNRRRDDDAPF